MAASVGAGGDGSFAAVYDQHVDSVYGYLGYRVVSAADAEDLTQATFERALAAWRRFDPERASPRTWLLAIAHNLLVDHHRRRSSRPREEPLEDAERSEPRGLAADASPRLGIEPELAAALALLTERERTLIALRFGGDLSGPEIAELTGHSLANVQQILSRSLRRLRRELEGPAAGGAAARRPPRLEAAAPSAAES